MSTDALLQYINLIGRQATNKTNYNWSIELFNPCLFGLRFSCFIDVTGLLGYALKLSGRDDRRIKSSAVSL